MTYLFVSADVDIIMSSVDIYLKCIGLFFIPLAIVNIYRNGIQGLGYGLLPMMAGVAELIGRGESQQEREVILVFAWPARLHGCWQEAS